MAPPGRAPESSTSRRESGTGALIGRWPGFVTKPFTHRQGREAGIPARALESSDFCKLLRGIYIHAQVTVDAVVEARAAVLAGTDGAFVSHHTAARLWGGIVPHVARPHLSVARGRPRSPREDMVVHSSSRTPTTFRAVPVTTPVDTFLDCATALDLVDLVILGDSLVKRDRLTPEHLVASVEAATGRGVRQAQTAAALVRVGVDSPMETRARLLRVLAGLPELTTDIRFHDDHGNLLRRLDAGDRQTRTAVEYDGRQHIDRQESWEADIGRREEFEDQEWRIVSLVSKDIFDTPGKTVERLRRIFIKRGIPVGRPKHTWRPHFPGRG